MIYKYFPRKPICIIGNGSEQKYFTENVFQSAVEVKGYLAIPYDPLYRVKIAPHKVHQDDLWEVFEDNIYQDQKKRRVWAAFGLHGGAWEMVTSQQFSEGNIEVANYAGSWYIDKVLFTGGYVEEYSSFKKATEHDSMLNLLKQFLQNYKIRGDRGEFAESKENFQWKIPDDFIGGIFYFRLQPFEYTISVLVKKCDDIYNGVKLWGTFWKDNENKRTVYRPVEVIVPGFPLLTEQEINNSYNSNNFKKFLDDRFDDIRKTLAKKSMSIPVDKLSEGYDIQLP